MPDNKRNKPVKNADEFFDKALKETPNRLSIEEKADIGDKQYGFKGDSQYDYSLLPGMDQQETRARRQGLASEIGNELLNTATGAVLGTGEMLGYLAASPNTIMTALSDEKTEFDNDFSQAMREAQENMSQEVAPVYQENPGQLDFGSREFYISQLGNLAESVLEFGGYGGVTGSLMKKAMSKGASGLTKLNNAGKLSRISKGIKNSQIAKGAEYTAQGATMASMSHAISTVGAINTNNVIKEMGKQMGPDKVYNNLINNRAKYYKNVEELSDEKALEEAMYDVSEEYGNYEEFRNNFDGFINNTAAESAASTYNATLLPSFLLNATTLAPFFRKNMRHINAIPKGKTRLSEARKALESVKNDPKKMAQINQNFKGIWNSKLAPYAFESTQESVEEISEMYGEQRGIAHGKGKYGFSDDVNMDPTATAFAATMGFLGGSLYKMSTQGFSRLNKKVTGQKGKADDTPVSAEDLINRKINILDEHENAYNELATLTEQFKQRRSEGADQEELDNLENQINDAFVRVQKNALNNAFDEETDNVIETELEYISNQASDEELDANYEAGADEMRSRAAITLSHIRGAKEANDQISGQNLPGDIALGIREQETKRALHNIYKDQFAKEAEEVYNQDGQDPSDVGRLYNRNRGYERLARSATDNKKLRQWASKKEQETSKQLKEFKEADESIDDDFLNERYNNTAVHLEMSRALNEYRAEEARERAKNLNNPNKRKNELNEIEKDREEQEQKQQLTGGVREVIESVGKYHKDGATQEATKQFSLDQLQHYRNIINKVQQSEEVSKLLTEDEKIAMNSIRESNFITDLINKKKKQNKAEVKENYRKRKQDAYDEYTARLRQEDKSKLQSEYFDKGDRVTYQGKKGTVQDVNDKTGKLLVKLDDGSIRRPKWDNSQLKKEDEIFNEKALYGYAPGDQVIYSGTVPKGRKGVVKSVNKDGIVTIETESGRISRVSHDNNDLRLVKEADVNLQETKKKQPASSKQEKPSQSQKSSPFGQAKKTDFSSEEKTTQTEESQQNPSEEETGSEKESTEEGTNTYANTEEGFEEESEKELGEETQETFQENFEEDPREEFDEDIPDPEEAGPVQSLKGQLKIAKDAANQHHSTSNQTVSGEKSTDLSDDDLEIETNYVLHEGRWMEPHKLKEYAAQYEDPAIRKEFERLLLNDYNHRAKQQNFPVYETFEELADNPESIIKLQRNKYNPEGNIYGVSLDENGNPKLKNSSNIFEGEPVGTQRDLFKQEDGRMVVDIPGRIKTGDTLYLLKDDRITFTGESENYFFAGLYEASDIKDNKPVEGSKPLITIRYNPSLFQRLKNGEVIKVKVSHHSIGFMNNVKIKDGDNVRSAKYSVNNYRDSDGNFNILGISGTESDNNIVIPLSGLTSKQEEKLKNHSNTYYDDFYGGYVMSGYSGDFKRGAVYMLVESANGSLIPAELQGQRISESDKNRIISDITESIATPDGQSRLKEEVYITNMGGFVSSDEDVFTRMEGRDIGFTYSEDLGTNNLFFKDPFNSNYIYEIQNAIIETSEGKQFRPLENFIENKQTFIKRHKIDGESDNYKVSRENVKEYFRRFEAVIANQYYNINRDTINHDDVINDISEKGKLWSDLHYKNPFIRSSLTVAVDNSNEEVNEQVINDTKTNPVENVRLTKKQSDKEEEESKETKNEPDELPFGDDVDEGDIDIDRDVKLKQAKEEGKPLLPDNEITWLKNTIGDNYVNVIDGIDRIMLNGGKQAYGMYHNAHITLARGAEAGSGYHEAFHFVFDQSLSSKEKTRLLKEGRRIYGKNVSDNEIEENLALDFEDYMRFGIEPEVKEAKGFFQRIVDFIKNLLGKKNAVIHTYEKIRSGNFNKNYSNNTNISGGDPKFKLVDERTSPAQERSIINGINYFLLNQMANNPDADITDQDQLYDFYEKVKEKHLKANSESLRSQANAAYNEYKRKYENNIEGANQDYNEYLKLKKGADTYDFVLERWDDQIIDNNNIIYGYKHKAQIELRNYGYTISLKYREGDNNEGLDYDEQARQDLSEEMSDERIHGIDFRLRDPKDSMQTKLRRRLASVSRMRYNSDGSVNYPKTLLGTPYNIDFDSLYNELQSSLSGLREYEIEGKIMEMAQYNPNFEAVRQMLQQERAAGSGVYEQFMSHFTKVNAQALKITEDGKVFNANQNNAFRQTRELWASNAYNSDLYTEEGVNTELAKQLEDELENAGKYSLQVEEQRDAVRNILSRIGISIPKPVFDEVFDKNQQDLYKRLFFGSSRGLPLLLSKLKQGKDIYATTGGESPSLQDIFKPLENKISDIITGSYRNINGDMVHPINFPNYVNEEFREIMETKGSFYESDKFYINYDESFGDNSNALLKLARHDRISKIYDRIGVFYLDGLLKSSFSNVGKDYDDMGTIESFKSMFYGFYSGHGDIHYFNTGTKGDKGQSIYAALPDIEWLYGKRVKSQAKAKEAAIEAWTDLVFREASRIRNIQNYPDIKTFSENAKRFNYIPSLNNIEGMFDSEGNLRFSSDYMNQEEMDNMTETIKQEVEKFLEERKQNFFRFLKDYNIIYQDNKGNYVSDHIKGNLDQRLNRFFYNDITWRNEWSQIFSGDLANYKSPEDFFKRNYASITPGQKLFEGDHETGTEGTHFNQLIFDDIKKETPLADIKGIASLTFGQKNQEVEKAVEDLYNGIKDNSITDINAHINNLIREKGKDFGDAVKTAISYRLNSKTDAASIATLEHWRSIAKGMGAWSSIHDYWYNNVWSKGKSVDQYVEETFTDSEQKEKMRKQGKSLLLQPLKPFYFGKRKIRGKDGNEYIIHEQRKDSIFPLVKELADSHPGYRDLYNRLHAIGDYEGLKPVDIASSSDAFKTGLYGSVSQDNLAEATVKVMPYKNMRIPQTIPEKLKRAKAGTQMEKIIMGNLNLTEKVYDLNGEKVTGEYLSNKFNQAWHEILRRDNEALAEELNAALNDGILTIPEDSDKKRKFIYNLRDILTRENIERELNDNYSDALRIVEELTHHVDEESNTTSSMDYNFSIPLHFPIFAKKFESLISSLFKNSVSKQKFPGRSFVNVADYGTKSEGKIDTSDELSFITADANGNPVEAEIGMVYEMAKKAGIEYNQYSEKRGYEDQLLIDFDPETGEGSGKVNWDALTDRQKELMKVFVYRIPTQGKNSAMAARVVRILPDNNGSAIMMPGEGTTQGGFDFDVDKSYVMFPSYEYEADETITEEDGKQYVKVNKKRPVKSKYDLNKPVSEYSKKQLHNLILDSHFSVFHSNENIGEFLNPIDDPLLSNKVEEYKNKDIISEQQRHIADPATNMEVETENKFAGALIGIQAVNLTSHSIGTNIPEAITTQGTNFYVPGDDGLELINVPFDGKYDIEGNRISDNLNIDANAYVDNANDPVSGKLNMNLMTGSVLAYLRREGWDKSSPIDFINQPVLRKLAAHYNGAGNKNLNQSINLLKQDMPNTINAYHSITKGNSTNLYQTISKDKLSKNLNGKDYKFQATVLADFVDYFYRASELRRLNSILSADTSPSYESHASLSNFVDDISHFMNNSRNIRFDISRLGVTTDNAGRIIANQESEQGRLQGYLQYSVIPAKRMLEQIMPYNTPLFTRTKDRIAERIGSPNDKLSKRQHDVVNFDIYNAIMNQSEVYETIRTESDNKWKELLFDKEKSLAKQLHEFKERKGLEKDLLFKYLSPDSRNKKNTLQRIIINDEISENGEKQNDIIRRWENHLKSKDPEIRDMAKKLVDYAMRVDGIKIGPGSFTHLIPVSYWESSGFIDKLNEVSGKSFEKLEYNEGFENDVIVNNPELIPTMDIKFDELVKKQKSDKSTKVVNTFTVYENNKLGLGRSGDNSYSDVRPFVDYAKIINPNNDVQTYDIYSLQEYNSEKGYATYKKLLINDSDFLTNSISLNKESNKRNKTVTC